MSAKSQHPAAVAQILDVLHQNLASADTAAWLLLGDALAALDELGAQSSDGRPWPEVLQAFHEGLGYGRLSVGHLQKIRRVRNFVRATSETGEACLTDDEISRAQLSALEVAERLHSLDAKRGQAALIACIGGRKFVDMQREYDEYVEQHPDRLPRRQATWLQKRKSAASDDAALIENVILADPVTFLDGTSAVLRPFQPAKASRFTGATDFGFRIVGPAGERTLGIEWILEKSLSKRDMVNRVSDLEFQSSFFDVYWVFAKADTAKVELLSSVMDEVRVDRVGLLRLSGESRDVIRRPRSCPPSPDRRDLLQLSG